MARVFAAFEQYSVKLDEVVATVVDVRSDTRIYFGEQNQASRDGGKCMGAFFLQNPGSASPASRSKNKGSGLQRWPWGAVNYGQEDLIPLLVSVLDDVATKISRRNAQTAAALRRDGYIQLLNLSYVKNAPKFGVALKQWQFLRAGKQCRDDVPDARKHFRFVVFGWGTAVINRQHRARIAQLLASCLPSRVEFVFPAGPSVMAGQRIVTVPAGKTADEIERQIKRSGCYPCGMRRGDVRATFPGRYRKAISACLARILLAS